MQDFPHINYIYLMACITAQHMQEHKDLPNIYKWHWEMRDGLLVNILHEIFGSKRKDLLKPFN